MEKSAYTTEHDSTDSDESTSSGNGSRRRVGGFSLSAASGGAPKAEVHKQQEEERQPVLLFSREMFNRVVDDGESSKKSDSHEDAEDDDEDSEEDNEKKAAAWPIIPRQVRKASEAHHQNQAEADGEGSEAESDSEADTEVTVPLPGHTPAATQPGQAEAGPVENAAEDQELPSDDHTPGRPWRYQEQPGSAEYTSTSPDDDEDTADQSTHAQAYYAQSPPPPPLQQGGGSGGNVPPQTPNIGGGNLPPPPPNGGFNAMPSYGFNPNNPYSYGYQNSGPNYNANYGYNANQAPQAPDTDALERQAQARGHRRGMRAGFLAGAVTGYWWRGRRAKREMAEANDKAREAADKQQKATNAREASYQEKVKALDNRNAELQRQVYDTEFRAHEAVKRGYESPSSVAVAGVAVRGAETGRLQAVQAAERPARPVEQVIAEQVDERKAAEKEVEQAPDHYVKSEWLRIGMTKEGRVDSNQTFGEAFQSELNKEQAGSRFQDNDNGKKRRTADDAGTNDVHMLGQFGLQGGGLQSSRQVGLNNRLDDGQADINHRLGGGTKGQILSNFTNPWFWLMLALLVGVFFAANLLG